MSSDKLESETAVGLLWKNDDIKTKHVDKYETDDTDSFGRRKKICYIICIIIVAVVLLLTISVVLLCFAEFAYPLRDTISEKFGIRLPGYQSPDTLESLTHPNMTQALTDASYENGNGSLSNSTIDKTIIAEYNAQAESSWNTAWEIVHDTQGWKLRKGSSLDTGRTYTKTYHGLGTVTKVEGYVDASVEELVKVLITDVEKFPEWVQGFEKSEILQNISHNVDIQYAITQPPIRLISRRDMVVLRHWEERENVIMLSGVSTTHPDRPPSDSIVRAKQKNSALMLSSVDGDPNRVLVKWTTSPEFGGWVPQWGVDVALATAMLDTLKRVRNRVQIVREQT